LGWEVGFSGWQTGGVRGAAGSRWRAAAVFAALLSLAACTGSDDEPRALTDSPSISGSPTSLPPASESSGEPATTDQPVSGDSTLALALNTVPAAATIISFTDLDQAKQRLGYEGLTSESLTRDRFDFWERARADGSLLTGTRLYDDTSQMALDYGWTGEDVRWEIDFTATEDGCVRSMLCEPAHGYILGLRDDLDWRTVLESLAHNNFTPRTSQIGQWATSDPSQPFSDLLLIPQLRAVASGNDIGIRRIAEVVEGAPSVATNTSALVNALGRVESAYVEPAGCVSLDEALGPDATDDDLDAFFKKNDPSALAEADGYAVGITDATSATVVLNQSEATASADAAARAPILDSWHSVQTGQPFSQVAQADARADGAQVRIDLAVHAMPTFRSMVLTHDAPWALCPAAPPA
jgi:hypothetical protein